MSDQAAILDVSPIAAHLRTAMPELVDVGTASTFGRLRAEIIRFPSAYVIPLSENSGPNRYQTQAVLSQRVVARFGVIWAVRDIADRFGSVAGGDIVAVRQAGMLAICQFRPDGAQGVIEPGRGQLVSAIDENGQMLWQDEFSFPMDRKVSLPA